MGECLIRPPGPIFMGTLVAPRNYEKRARSKLFYDYRYFKRYMEGWDLKKKLMFLKTVKELELADPLKLYDGSVQYLEQHS